MKQSNIKLTLTEPQTFWLGLLLESRLSEGMPSRATASYEAILRKLDLVKRVKRGKG